MHSNRTIRPFLPWILASFLCGAAAFAQDDAEPRGWLGIQFQTQTLQLDDGDPRTGFRILGIVEDGPAARAGLRAQDFIMSIDGSLPGDAEALVHAISEAGPGESLQFTVRRRDDTLTRSIRLGDTPDDPSAATIRNGWIGVRSIDLPPPLQAHFGAEEGRGAMLFEVDQGSSAEAAGLRVGDLVVAVEGADVGGAGSLRRLLSRGGVGNELEIDVMRDGVALTVEARVDVEPPRDPEADLDEARRRYEERRRRAADRRGDDSGN